ncbi:MAG: OmpA family protein [Saprospiraceae bacterium]|nr:OmpA family protein [Saprospiraceae bacterium]MCB9323159.1 OmpA family protein [Lewinellaceae bacterium]
MKKLYFLAIFLLAINISSQAQDKWEAGIFLGGSSYFGDLVHSDFFPYLDQTRFAYGANVRYSFLPVFSAQLNFLHSGLKGDDAIRADKGYEVPNRNISFTSGVNQIGLLFRYEPLANKRYADGAFKRLISPYITAGVAYDFMKVEADYSKAAGGYVALGQQDQTALNDKNSHLNLPIGGGIRFDLNEKVGLDLGFTVNRASSDLLDGVSLSGNPDNNDWYLAGGLTLAMKLSGKKDTDKDGIADKDDACPDMAGTAGTKGCPDTDGDGVADKDDNCPLEKGILFGCPDSDNDGISDKDEGLMGTDPKNPDTDSDGIMDGKENLNGNATVDAGESNPLDACDPDKNNANCDLDGDGLINAIDQCPTVFGEKLLEGCPDADGDGIPDKDDKCPNEVGPKSNNGCSELQDNEKEVLTVAIKNIQFETAQAVLKQVSIPVLKQIADIMKKYPYYSLKISGHTDNVGDPNKNQNLSELRAEACMIWLNANGIAKSRMESKGYGESKPIATNNTEEGRAQNRRVEFDLIIK